MNKLEAEVEVPFRPLSALNEQPIGYINANPYTVSFSVLGGTATVALEANQQLMDESTGKRVIYHPELEHHVRIKDLKYLYPSDLMAKPKKLPNQRQINAEVSNAETHQRLQSSGKFQPEGLPTTRISTERGPEEMNNTQSPQSRPMTELEEANLNNEPNVAIVRAADRANASATIEEKNVKTVTSVIWTDEDGIPEGAQKEGNAFIFEGVSYAGKTALTRYLKTSGRPLRVRDLAEQED